MVFFCKKLRSGSTNALHSDKMLLIDLLQIRYLKVDNSNFSKKEWFVLELKQLCKKTLEIFEINDIKCLQEKLFDCVRKNDVKIYDKFRSLVGDLSVDWLQMIFQYYYADRKEKMQDYTPRTLADFIGRLVGESEIIIDMCAGSGALTIQKWNRNHDLKFRLYEYDERVIPFLLFNMALRNIDCMIYHSDVLQDETYHTYKIRKGDVYGIFEEVENGNSTYI